MPDEIRMYAFQLKKQYNLESVNAAYYMLLQTGMKVLQENVPRSYLPSDARGRRRKNSDILNFSVVIKTKADEES